MGRTSGFVKITETSSGITWNWRYRGFADEKPFILRAHRLFNSRVTIRTEPPHVKTNKMIVRPVKTQISLGMRPVWSESSLCAQWVAKDPYFLHADSENSDQTGRMPRLTWVFAGRTCHLVGFVMRRLITLMSRHMREETLVLCG